MNTPSKPPISAECLIPHEPPMCWVKQLLSLHEGEAWVESHRLADNPLFSEVQTLPLYVMAELIAQSYAVVKGYQDLSAGRPIRRGFLVGIRRMEVYAPVSGDRPLSIRIRPTGAFGGFFMADGTVILDGENIAEGTVKVWVPENAEAKNGR